MSDERKPSLWGAYLEDSQLTLHRRWLESDGARGTRIDLAGLDLHGAKVLGTFMRARLVGCDLSESWLQGCHFEDAEISGCSFDRATMNLTFFDGAGVDGTSFAGAELVVSR